MNTSHTLSTSSRLAMTLLASIGLLFGGLLCPAGAQSDTPAPAPGAAGDTVQSAPVRPEPTPVELAQGQALLDRAVKATFTEKASSLKSFAFTDSGSFFIGTQTFPLTTKNVLTLPDCYWQEQVLPIGVQTTGFCNGSGWIKNPSELRDLVPMEVKSLDQDHEMSLLRILLDAAILKVRPLPDTVLAAGPAAGISVITETAEDWRIWMNKKSGRIVRSDYIDMSPAGGGAKTRHAWEFYDYQPVGKLLQWPTLRKKFVGGAPFLELGLKSAECNPNPPSSLYEKPKP